MTLDEIIKRRAVVENKIKQALAHISVSEQLSVVMAWISIDDLEAMAKTICKDGVERKVHNYKSRT